ncbi:putative ABC-type xenobiotic transporter [Helianthus anomalus]
MGLRVDYEALGRWCTTMTYSALTEQGSSTRSCCFSHVGQAKTGNHTLSNGTTVKGRLKERRKRLTVAVEVVANPSIIFMDEPTTGLDARSAAIVMRAVNNIVDTGRTIVCTIHQPSVDIFEAFDELILLKNGGQMIYCGPMGHSSCRVIEYFESISGVPKIRDNYNPATWVLEVTSALVEAKVGVDFGQIYSTSTLYE